MYGAITFGSNSGCQMLFSGGTINVDPQSANNGTATAFTLGSLTYVNWTGGDLVIADPHKCSR